VRRGSEDGGGVPVVGVPESDGKVARKLLRVDVVRMVSSVRAKRWRSGGTTASRNGGGGRVHWRCGPGGVDAREWN
jgi:hypothetical protein